MKMNMKSKKGFALIELIVVLVIATMVLTIIVGAGMAIHDVTKYKQEKQEHREKFQRKVGEIVQFKLDDRKGIVVENLKDSCTFNDNGQHYYKIGDYQYKIRIKLDGEYRTLMIGQHELVPRDGESNGLEERITFEE